MESLLLKACLDGKFGEKIEYENGGLYLAGFAYLAGTPDDDLCALLPEKWGNRMFVCLSDEWKNALSARYPDIFVTTRYIMQSNGFDTEHLRTLIENAPDGITISEFDENAFIEKPFSHGANYKSFEEFKKLGAGAVARDGDKIVSSSSSFLSYGDGVELDISTLPEYRKRGIGIACAAMMLKICCERGINAHWDAQNTASRKMAEKLGYKCAGSYKGYTFFNVEELEQK